ncbi:hypothetical protein HDU97_003003 [Phlyctochytrium planicorne]|nr:hypothetical protein HDU97_003003 [Phlyctochytrium planicorne]
MHSATIASLAVSFLAFSAANAQVVLVSPLARGYNKDQSTQAPCGGFDTPVNPVAMKLTKPNITISAYVANGNWTVNLKKSSDAAFTSIAIGSLPQALIAPTLPWTQEIEYADPSKVQSLAKDNAGVIQFILELDGVKWYQCADVVMDPSSPPAQRTDPGLQTIPSTVPNGGTLPASSTTSPATATTSQANTATVSAGPTTSGSPAPATSTKPSSGEKVAVAGWALVAGVAGVLAL